MTGMFRERIGHEAKVYPVELFFDLVFVFAVTQLSHFLLGHLNPMGMLQTLLMFMGIWWIWIFTSWITNWLHPDHISVRLMLFALMIAAMVLAMSMDKAWAERGLIYAGALVFIQVGRTIFMMFASYRSNDVLFRTFLRIVIWFGSSGIFWIAGGFAQGDMRLLFWAMALGIEYLGPPMLFWVPGLGRSGSQDWNIDGGHLAERCGLFMIIALGESIIVTGATAAKLPWDFVILSTFAAAIIGTIAMWWIYFNIGAERGTHHIAHSVDPGRYGRLVYNYIHLPIVAGVIVSAAGDELIMLHPYGHLDIIHASVILGGPILFLIGNMLFKRTTAQYFPLSHLVGLGLFCMVSGTVPYLSPIIVGISATAILVMVAIWETRSLQSAKT